MLHSRNTKLVIICPLKGAGPTLGAKLFEDPISEPAVGPVFSYRHSQNMCLPNFINRAI